MTSGNNTEVDVKGEMIQADKNEKKMITSLYSICKFKQERCQLRSGCQRPHTFPGTAIYRHCFLLPPPYYLFFKVSLLHCEPKLRENRLNSECM